jgi:hypothetical protein
VSRNSLFLRVFIPTPIRSYVYDDFTWDADGRNYSDFNGKLIPARIPLSTMLSGHLLGLSEEEYAQETSPPPRSISRPVYERICPKAERVLIKGEIVQAYLKKIQSPINLNADSGLDVLHGWLAALNSPKYKAARCIEVERGSFHVFDIWYAPKIFVVVNANPDPEIGCLEVPVCTICGHDYPCRQPSSTGAGHH